MAISPCWTAARTDEEIIAIPFADPTYNTCRDLADLPAHIFDEMAHFFSVYKALEGKELWLASLNDRAAAVEVIQRAMKHYTDSFLGGGAPEGGSYSSAR